MTEWRGEVAEMWQCGGETSGGVAMWRCGEAVEWRSDDVARIWSGGGGKSLNPVKGSSKCNCAFVKIHLLL